MYIQLKLVMLEAILPIRLIKKSAQVGRLFGLISAGRWQDLQNGNKFFVCFFSFLLPISINILADLSLYVFRKQ